MTRRSVGVVVEVGIGEERQAAPAPAPSIARITCPRCEAVLATRADLRRVRHVLLRCNCGGFQRVALADVA